MRLATILDARGPRVAVVGDGGRALVVEPRIDMRTLAGDPGALDRLRTWTTSQPASAWLAIEGLAIGPAVPDPGAIYTVGLNYDGPGAAPRPAVPMVYGKAASSVGAHGGSLTWDRSVTDNVDAECELGVVIGPDGAVFGYTIVNDISARDEALDGDQWLLGKSMPGFAPIGPWIVPADALDVGDLALGCTINGEAIQAGRTSDMRFSVAEIVRYLSRHLVLRPGDIIASGTPPRLATPPGPGRRLRAGDAVTCWIEGIGELATRVGA